MIEADWLYAAFQADDPEAAQRILNGANARIDGPLLWKGSQSPCEVACLLDARRVLSWLLKSGLSPQKKGRSIPLITAVGMDKIECVRLLLKAGADANVKEGSNSEGDRGWTALMYAVDAENMPMVDVLLEAGADPNAISKRGLCAASLACERRHAGIVNQLISRGCRTFGRAALFPSKYGDAELLKSIIKAGADVNVVGTKDDGLGERNGPIESALGSLLNLRIFEEVGTLSPTDTRKARYHEVVNILIAAGIDVNRLCISRMPLHTAVFVGDLEVVRALLKAGADPNSIAISPLSRLREQFGPRSGPLYFNTALHEASAKGHLEIVNELITGGAEVNLPDHEGFTPLNLAFEKGHREIARMLRDAGGVEGPVALTADIIRRMQQRT